MRNPERMLDIVFPACQTAIRIGFSSFVYQDEVTGSFVQFQVSKVHLGKNLLRVMAGKKGASNSPVKNRMIQKSTPLWIATVYIV